MAMGYIIISQRPDGSLGYVKYDSQLVTSPQQAVYQYTKAGKFTPVTWAYMEQYDLDSDTKQDVYDEAVADGRIVEKNASGQYVARIPAKLTKVNPDIADLMGTPITPGPRKPKPEICPEVWRVKPDVDTTDYMAAVRDMCKGV